MRSDRRFLTQINELSLQSSRFSARPPRFAGSSGRASYEQIRKEVMTSSSQFIEIDLLRDGKRLHCRDLLPPRTISSMFHERMHN